MTKYRVYLEAVASFVAEVDADDTDNAIEAALAETPTPKINWPDLGDWYFPPDVRTNVSYEEFMEEIEE